MHHFMYLLLGVAVLITTCAYGYEIYEENEEDDRLNEVEDHGLDDHHLRKQHAQSRKDEARTIVVVPGRSSAALAKPKKNLEVIGYFTFAGADGAINHVKYYKEAKPKLEKHHELRSGNRASPKRQNVLGDAAKDFERALSYVNNQPGKHKNVEELYEKEAARHGYNPSHIGKQTQGLYQRHKQNHNVRAEVDGRYRQILNQGHQVHRGRLGNHAYVDNADYENYHKALRDYHQQLHWLRNGDIYNREHHHHHHQIHEDHHEQQVDNDDDEEEEDDEGEDDGDDEGDDEDGEDSQEEENQDENEHGYRPYRGRYYYRH